MNCRIFFGTIFGISKKSQNQILTPEITLNMKKTTLILFLLFIISGCEVKQTQQLVSTGNYDEAINNALANLRTNKDKKGKQDYVYLLEEAFAKAKELYTTPTMQAYNSLRVMLNNIGEYMETAKVTAGRDGNLPSLIRLAKEFDSIRQSFKGVAKDLAEEQKSTARGGQDLAYDEEGE